MPKNKRSRPDVEEMLGRPWCYYCERDFEDLKLLISHQKAKHFKCDRCGRRLNTAGGLSVHMTQVHKETLEQVENALPNRSGLEVEIFGMEGIPQDAAESHKNRLIQNFYQAQEDRRIATGNAPPGQANHKRKPIPYESKEELLARFRDWRAKREAALAAGEDPNAIQSNGNPNQAPAQPATQASLGFPEGAVHGGIPQRPAAAGDDIDDLIRLAEAGVKPPTPAAPAAPAAAAPPAASKPAKKDKSKMVYNDGETSPEEHMAALPRYAFTAA